MERSEIFHLENRRRIYNCVLNNPGLHIRGVAKRLRLTYYNVNYHLNYLKKLGLISIKTENSFSRIYCMDSMGKEDKEVLNLIRQKTPRHLLIFMCTYVVTSQKELSDHLDKHPTTITFHLKKLIDAGVIEPAETLNGITISKHPSGKNVERVPKTSETLYRIKNYSLVRKLFITYHKSLFKDKIFKFGYENVVRLTKEGKAYNKDKKNMKPFDHYVDFIIDVTYDIFPHPYYG